MGRGLLTFKGDAAPKKKKSNKKRNQIAIDGNSGSSDKNPSQPTPTIITSLQSHNNNKSNHTSNTSSTLPLLLPGTGFVMTSGTVVTGIGTKFETELAAGDAMVMMDQTRVVTMRLSNTSCGISSALSSDLNTQAPFFIIKKPKLQRPAQHHDENVDITSTQTNDEQQEVVYREKTNHGSYRIQRVTVAINKSRSDILKLRTKKTSDKYC